MRKSEYEGYIETFTGIKFFLDKPEFSITDIAWALSNNCRYNGHCHKFYSVAEHSVLVARLMETMGGDPREGLLHDATEAYLSDIPAPFKQFLPDVRRVDASLEAKMREHYGLPEEKTSECHEADVTALHGEAHFLIKSGGAAWGCPYPGLKQVGVGFCKRYFEHRGLGHDPVRAFYMFQQACVKYGVEVPLLEPVT